MMLKTALYIIAVIIIFIIGTFILFTTAGNNAAEYVGRFKPDMSQIEDGSYEGAYSSIFDKFGAKITFDVKDGQLKHFHFDQLFGTIGYGGSESVIMKINEQKDLNFDVISGATITSNLAKAAIKTALENGPAE
jgi:uncharacterized protein with FMN-binding domain